MKTRLLRHYFVFFFVGIITFFGCNSGSTPATQQDQENPQSQEPPKDPSSLPILNAETNFSIDMISGVQPQGDPISISSESINISGWAIDKVNNNNASAVFIDIDGRLFPTTYLLERGDVAEAFQNQNLLSSGFEVKIPASQFSKGEHTLSLKIVSNDGRGYYAPEAFIKIIIQ